MPHRRVGALTGTVAAGAPRRSSPRTHRRPGGSHVFAYPHYGSTDATPRRTVVCGGGPAPPCLGRDERRRGWGGVAPQPPFPGTPSSVNRGVDRVAAKGAEDCCEDAVVVSSSARSERMTAASGRGVVTGPPEPAASPRGRPRCRLRAPSGRRAFGPGCVEAVTSPGV